MHLNNKVKNMIETFNNIASEPIASWGGAWTEDKLDTFEKYVRAYLTIMNKYRDLYNWKLIYFDGFAGSGSRSIDNTDDDSDNMILELFENHYIQSEDISMYKGAAERVLGIQQKGFDYYYFIDKDESANNLLKSKLESLHPDKKGRLVFRPNDANTEVEKMADFLRQNINYKALVLLDPFGMQLNWQSIQKLQNTGTDLWILIPTGVIVNRLLDRKGELKHIDTLTAFFGKDEDFIRDYFYKQRTEPSLFGDNTTIEKVREPIRKIAELYLQQLKGIFKFATPEPLVLYNSRHTPIFHFAFASNNKNAVKIAKQIIGKM